jgi:hypothetical protein
MKILIGCEESQTVCNAFRDKGHEAYSCDIQECSGNNPQWHIQDDIFNVLKNNSFDMLIAHPPCTYLTNAGIKFFDENIYKEKAIERKIKRQEAVNFFLKLWNYPIQRICLENPPGYINSIIKPNQTIHPYFFGEQHCKRTCLWLKGLPGLQWSNYNTLFYYKTSCQKPDPSFTWINKNGKVKNEYFTYNKNSKERSKTFKKIAEAMANQW